MPRLAFSERKKAGFTLMEMLIYAAVLAVVSVLAVNTVLIITRSLGAAGADRALGSSAEVAMERMVREARFAGSIDTTDSVLGTSPGRLTLNTIDPASGAPRKVSFMLDNGTLALAVDGGAAYPLTDDNVTITELVFRLVTNASSSQAVRIQIDISAGSGAYGKSKTFYDTAVLRRSY